MGEPSGTGDLKIDEEFDIDDANRKFDKSQLVKEFAGLGIHEEGKILILMIIQSRHHFTKCPFIKSNDKFKKVVLSC